MSHHAVEAKPENTTEAGATCSTTAHRKNSNVVAGSGNTPSAQQHTVDATSAAASTRPSGAPVARPTSHTAATHRAMTVAARTLSDSLPTGAGPAAGGALEAAGLPGRLAGGGKPG